MLKSPFLISGLMALFILSGCGSSASTNAASVEYSVDMNGCLTSQNAEAVVNYSNGTYRSKTFIWNCASLAGNSQRMRYEEFFVSYDGGRCYYHYQENAGDAICTERATAPDSPVFDAAISGFELSPVIALNASGYEVNAQLTNIGNATLYNLYLDINDQYSFLHQGAGWLITGPSITQSEHAAKTSSILPSNSFDVTLTLKMWDGSVLDTQTKTVIIP